MADIHQNITYAGNCWLIQVCCKRTIEAVIFLNIIEKNNELFETLLVLVHSDFCSYMSIASMILFCDFVAEAASHHYGAPGSTDLYSFLYLKLGKYVYFVYSRYCGTLEGKCMNFQKSSLGTIFTLVPI